MILLCYIPFVVLLLSLYFTLHVIPFIHRGLLLILKYVSFCLSIYMFFHLMSHSRPFGRPLEDSNDYGFCDQRPKLQL